MDGLNYYDDNGASHGGLWAGQTFTTGTNAQGYYLTSVAFQTGWRRQCASRHSPTV